MAKKKKTWRPTEAQLGRINDLIIVAHKVRRLKTHPVEPDSTFRVQNVPDRVIPKRERKKNFNSFNSYEQYRRELKRLKKMYSEGAVSWDRENYKKVYLKALLDMMGSSDSYGYMELPDVRGVYFSKDQIEFAEANNEEELAVFMQWYNKVQSMSVSKFMQMYERGYIVYLRYLYRDMIDSSGMSDFMEEQLDNYRTFNKIMTIHSSRETDTGHGYSKSRMIKPYPEGKYEN